jgi:hypothetical protein
LKASGSVWATAAIALGYSVAIAALLMTIGVLLGGGLLWIVTIGFPMSALSRDRKAPKRSSWRNGGLCDDDGFGYCFRLGDDFGRAGDRGELATEL